MVVMGEVKNFDCEKSLSKVTSDEIAFKVIKKAIEKKRVIGHE